jgi:SAM-dependent methyltransferase
MKNYYDENKNEFIDNTINCDMSFHYALFEKYLNNNSKMILDLGFGSGRDIIYFSKKGFSVIGIDPTKVFVNLMKQKGYEVYEAYAQNIAYEDKFDGIWACASLLHVPGIELVEVFNKCYRALKYDGIMYCSFKNGTYEGIRDGRYYTDLNEDMFKSIISKTNFEIVDICTTKDVRPERKEEWLNCIIKK